MGFEFEVIGDIKGKARPRVNTQTCRAYTPTNTKDYEMLVKQYFKVKYPRYVPLENRVKVIIDAKFKIPKTTTKKEVKEEKIKVIIRSRFRAGSCFYAKFNNNHS